MPGGRRHAGPYFLRQYHQEGVIHQPVPGSWASICSCSTARRSWKRLRRTPPGTRVFCRLIVGTEGAVFPLARKFGTGMDMAAELMLKAADLGLDPYGLSFHVGSQQMSPEAHEAAIGQAAMLFDELAQAGVSLRMVNLGGGFPAHYQDEIPAIGRLRPRHYPPPPLAFHFGNSLPEVLVEPGRFLVGRCRRCGGRSGAGEPPGQKRTDPLGVSGTSAVSAAWRRPKTRRRAI